MDLGVVVIDDRRTFSNRESVTYAKNAREGLRVLAQKARIDELWLDHDLGDGVDIRPILRLLCEAAESGRPLDIGTIYVHTANVVRGDAMVDTLSRYYRAFRVQAVPNGLVDVDEDW